MLNERVRQGKIRHLGIALGSSDNLHQAQCATQVGATVVQLTYNRLNRDAERRVFASSDEQDLGVLAREPLANGYLTGRYRPGAGVTGSRDWRAGMDEQEVARRLDAAERIQATEVPPGTSMARWALGWCLRHPTVDAVVTGVKSVEQLESSAAATDLAVT